MTGGAIGGPNAADGNQSGASGGGLYFTNGSDTTVSMALVVVC